MALGYIVPMIICIAIFVVLIQNICFQVCFIDVLLGCWYFFVVIYSYIYTVYPVASVVVKATIFLCLFYALRFILQTYEYREYTISVLIVVISYAEALIGIYQVYVGYSRNNTQIMTGTFLNSGPFGIMLSCGLVQFISLIKKNNKNVLNKSVVIFLIFAVGGVMLAVLLATKSRTAILALTIYLLYVYRHKLKGNLLKISSCFIVLILFLLCIKLYSAIGRIMIWWISLNSILNHPIIGSGIGSFKNQYAEIIERLSMDMKDGDFNNTDIVHHAFNIFLHIGVEQGAIGLFFVVMIIIFIMKFIVQSRSIDNWVILVLLFSSLFSYTFDLLPFQIIAVLVVASLVSQSCGSMGGYKIPIIPTLTIFLMVSFIAFVPIRKKVFANERYIKIKGIYTSENIQDYYCLLPYMQDNAFFLFDFAKILSNSKRYNDSNAVLRKGQLISTDPMFYIIQGNNYANMGEFELAESCYIKGYRVMPNRIYPLYRLMLLYEKNGLRKKTIIIAKRIIAYPVKIESKATLEMKQKALEIINGYEFVVDY